MRKIRHLPDNDNSNGWSRILPPRIAKPALQENITVDWVVVGAGYAGLAAARRLAENRPNDSIALIDAGEVGENASGRNSGFAIDLPHLVSTSKDELEGSHHYMALSRAAIENHEEQITKFGINCDWSQPGKYQTAVSDWGVEESLQPFAHELEMLNEEYQWIEGRELSEILGATHFKAAVYTPGCRLLNPAALVRGLADNLPENVSLYENCPVVGIDVGKRVKLATKAGSIDAGQMILGVNAFASYFGYYQNQLIPFAADASLSRQLSDDEQKALGCSGEWGVTPANAFASITMRYTQDHRILIRNNIYYNYRMRETQQHRDDMAVRHKKLFDERFPMLKEVNMEYTWAGYVCFSNNGAPGFGQIADNVYSSICQNAIGVTKGTIGGLLAADMACGVDNELIGFMQSLGEPGKVPPRPLLDIGVKCRTGWELWKARNEV